MQRHIHFDVGSPSKGHYIVRQTYGHCTLLCWPNFGVHLIRLASAPFCVIGFPWPVPGLPIAFLACAGQERRTTLSSSSPAGTAGTSYQNDEEAAAVLKVLQQLLSGPDALQARDIGVITPYSGQVPKLLPWCIPWDGHQSKTLCQQ